MMNKAIFEEKWNVIRGQINARWSLMVEYDPQISALLGVLPLQLLSYHMSVMRGFDPDFPRNLSKTLTVD